MFLDLTKETFASKQLASSILTTSRLDDAIICVRQIITSESLYGKN